MKKKILIIVSALLVICAVAAGIYVNDYYRAYDEAFLCIEEASKENGDYVFYAEEAETGVIFYPGGKVQAESYAPLMEELAQRGVLSVLVSMPANLAVLDVNGADGFVEKFPDIKNWYMAGHSLGGSMAASYLDENAGKFDGLILLASYSTTDLSDRDLKVLSIYGENDKVLNLEAYEENKSNLPNLTEVVIDGGNHAGFGFYGPQDGDGDAEISKVEQINKTADEIFNFIK